MAEAAKPVKQAVKEIVGDAVPLQAVEAKAKEEETSLLEAAQRIAKEVAAESKEAREAADKEAEAALEAAVPDASIPDVRPDSVFVGSEYAVPKADSAAGDTASVTEIGEVTKDDAKTNGAKAVEDVTSGGSSKSKLKPQASHKNLNTDAKSASAAASTDKAEPSVKPAAASQSDSKAAKLQTQKSVTKQSQDPAADNNVNEKTPLLAQSNTKMDANSTAAETHDVENPADATKGGGATTAAVDTAAQAPAPKPPVLLLDHVEHFLEGCMLVLSPVIDFLGAWFGVSILLYGMDFKTMAFNILIFRVTGYKAVVMNWQTLKDQYVAARQATAAAARSTMALQQSTTELEEQRVAREAMIRDRAAMLKDGVVTREEAAAFIDKHRKELKGLLAQKMTLQASSSSVAALKDAVSWQTINFSLKNLYGSIVASITASTFEIAGQLTMAIYCGQVLKTDMMILFGPYIDPLGYEAHLETYITAIVTGPANAIASTVSICGTLLLILLFKHRPESALQVSLCFLGSGLVLQFIHKTSSRIRKWTHSKRRRLSGTPASAILHLLMTFLGWWFHQNAGFMRVVCDPFIDLLTAANTLLNEFSLTNVDWFHRSRKHPN